MRYLYVLGNFFGEEALARREFEALSGEKIKRSWAVIEKRIPAEKSAYIKYCVKLLAQAPTIESLLKKINDLSINNFIVVSHNIRNHQKLCKQIADTIQGEGNMRDPTTTLMVLLIENTYYLGELVHSLSNFWSTHKSKQNISTSLPARIARAMVNLVHPAKRIVDPCCGSGTILIEGSRIGCEMIGYDIHLHVVELALMNLATFNLKAHVEVGDATAICGDSDAVVTDPPYTGDPLPILQNLRNLAPRAVYVTNKRIEPLLDKLGYKLENVTEVRKHTTLRRYVYEFRTST